MNLLCWNIQKSSLKLEFKKEFFHLLKRYSIDIAALQEIKLPKNDVPIYFQSFYTAFGLNFQRELYRYGVMTLSKSPIVDERAFKTKTKEAFIATKKSFIVTKHKIANNKYITLVNIHAINFVPYRVFAKEIEHTMKIFYNIEDSKVIVAGDFNTWSKKRERLFDDKLKNLGFAPLVFEDSKKRKSFLGMPLDRVYYKGVEAILSSVIETDISDHNPIYVKFRI